MKGPVVSVVSLGCPKNTVDTERLLALFASKGILVAEDPEDAQVVVVNTCGFIKAAVRESLDVVAEMKGMKKKVIAVGCLVNRLGRSVDGADASVPLSRMHELPRVVRSVASRPSARPRPCTPGPLTDDFRLIPRVRTTSVAWSYLKLSEGCDNRCSYCTIPSIRGPLRSAPPEELAGEAKGLAELGTRELVLIAQDTFAYGLDIAGRCLLDDLLGRLDSIPGLARVRLMYAHPAHVPEDAPRLWEKHPRLCRYLDVPIQHVSDVVLERMNRRATRKGLEELVRRLREEVPGIALRTTLMVGFPGEADSDFEQVLELVEWARFESLGVFVYSREEGTPAARMTGVPGKIARERLRVLMEVQQRIAFDLLDSRVGGDEEVLVEEGGVGRTEKEAPLVDGLVIFRGREPPAGELVRARIAAREDYDLIAEIKN